VEEAIASLEQLGKKKRPDTGNGRNGHQNGKRIFWFDSEKQPKIATTTHNQ
jgi:hypothetical protein